METYGFSDQQARVICTRSPECFGAAGADSLRDPLALLK